MARISAWQRRAKADKWLWGAAFLIGAWGFLYPLPYALCIAVLGAGALTFLTLPFVAPRRFPLLKKNGKTGTATQIAVIFIFVLTLRALFDFDLLDWLGPLTVAAMVALLLAGIALSALRRAGRAPPRATARNTVTAFLFMGLGLGWGIAVEANILLDRSEPRTFRLRVEDKWVTGRYRRPHLRLAPEVEELGGTSFHVDSRLYERAEVGRTVCVEERQGFLGFRWYRVEICSEQGR